jgi:hypothetical protein
MLWVLGRDFLGLVMNIEQPNFQSEFKKNNFASQKVRKLIFKQKYIIIMKKSLT